MTLLFECSAACIALPFCTPIKNNHFLGENMYFFRVGNLGPAILFSSCIYNSWKGVVFKISTLSQGNNIFVIVDLKCKTWKRS